ncbi:Lrp/AsnC family transcriptional regulator [Marinicella sediminis]|uniref:Lrp/AsnC family transcriptional regulator n=1 Tax=Marinicella sediminis TaxID=1792834 RepID=A0ABV7J9R6_9GAMM|nr:Lrp/AsnC family transcriptional regulator [Marinicella sediminis]
MNELDSFDLSILKVLQEDSSIHMQALAERVNLSKTPCWRRVKKLEESGYIRKYVALLDHRKLGLSVMAYVQVSMKDHDLNTLQVFLDFVEQSPYILDCHATAGNFDYVMKVIAADTEELENFLMRELLSSGVIQSTNTNLILRQKKSTTELPVK